MEIIFATSNQNKVKEINVILPDTIKLLSLKDIDFKDEIEETGSTIEENSMLKAKAIFDRYKKPVLAEDTGLEVFMLNNEPGVYSARYAGKPYNAEKNMDLLLEKLKNEKNRNAKFKTVATFLNEDTLFICRGEVLGEITKEKFGSEGFGYDPIFKPHGFDKVFAEMTMKQKSFVSHRAIAIKRFVTFVENKLN